MKRSNSSRKSPRHLRLSRLFFAAAIIVGATAALLLLPGCASIAAVARSLQKDTNSISLHLQVMGNQLDYGRNTPAGK